MLIMVNFLASSASQPILEAMLSNSSVEIFKLYVAPVSAVWNNIPADYHLYTLGGILLLSFILLIMAKCASRLRPVLSRKKRRQFADQKVYLSEVIKAKKQQLYSDYLKQSVADHDL